MGSEKDRLEKKIDSLFNKLNAHYCLKNIESIVSIAKEIEVFDDKNIPEVAVKKFNHMAKHLLKYLPNNIHQALNLYVRSFNINPEQTDVLDKCVSIAYYTNNQALYNELTSLKQVIAPNIQSPNFEFLSEITLYHKKFENAAFFLNEAHKSNSNKSLFEKTGYYYFATKNYEKALKMYELAGDELTDGCDVFFRKPHLDLIPPKSAKFNKLAKQIVELEPYDIGNRIMYLLSSIDKKELVKQINTSKHLLKLVENEEEKALTKSRILIKEAHFYIDEQMYQKAESLFKEAISLSQEELNKVSYAAFLGLTRRFPEMELIIQELRESKSNSLNFAEAQYYFHKGMYLEAIKRGAEYISKKDKLDYINNLRGISLDIVKQSIDEIGSINEVINLLAEDSKIEKDPLPFEVLTIIYDYKKDILKSSEYSKKLLDIILNTKEYVNELEELESRRKNRILFLSTNELSKNIYFVKGNKKILSIEQEHDCLKNEYIAQLLAKKTLEDLIGTENVSEENMKIAYPLLLHQDDENTLLISRMLKKEDLTPNISRLSNNQLNNEIKMALENLAIIQGGAMRSLNLKKDGAHLNISDNQKNYKHVFQYFNHMDNIIKRFVGTIEQPRFGINDELNQFLENYEKFIDQKQQYAFVHGDFFKGNVFMEGFIIDFEKACIGDPTLDVAQLLTDPVFKELDKDKLVMHHYNKLNEYIPVNKELYFSNYHKNFVHCSLGHAGSHLLDDKPEFRYYFKQAKRNMPSDLRNSFEKYIGASNKKELLNTI